MTNEIERMWGEGSPYIAILPRSSRPPVASPSSQHGSFQSAPEAGMNQTALLQNLCSNYRPLIPQSKTSLVTSKGNVCLIFHALVGIKFA